MRSRYLRLSRILMPTLTGVMILIQSPLVTAQAISKDTMEYAVDKYDSIAVDYYAKEHTGDATDLVKGSRFINNDGDSVVYGASATITNVKDFIDYNSDIKGKWSESYISTLFSKGGIKGYVDGTFRPKANITTAELLSLIINTAGKQADITNWPQGVMNQANELGLVDSSMMTEGNKPIPREKMAYIIVAAAKMLGEDTSNVVLIDESRIPDLSKASNEYQNAIRVAYSMGLLAGNDSVGTFKPSSSTTREETCVIISRLFKYVDRLDVNNTKPEAHKPEAKPEQPAVTPGKQWKPSDFEYGNGEYDSKFDPNNNIGDLTGAIYPKEGDIGPNGKPITRDPVTGVLGYGNGQKGGIYLNRTYHSTLHNMDFTVKVGDMTTGDKIRGMDGVYRQNGNYVFWDCEWSWIRAAAKDKLANTQGSKGMHADPYGNVYTGSDVAGEAMFTHDGYAWKCNWTIG